MIKKVTIYGERCSGTNYLEELLVTNFDVKIVWNYGWKHFFGFNDLSNSNDVLFIGIVRNITDWINSLFRTPHHLPSELSKDINSFLNNSFYSITNNGTLHNQDKNIYTKQIYKNIFEMRHTKNKFLVEDMPKLVKNYILITHENLLNDFANTMNKIKSFNLPIKNKIQFPLNITYYKKEKNVKFGKKPNLISRELILKNANLFYEKKIFGNNY